MAVITSFPIKLSTEEAKREARKSNGLLARLIMAGAVKSKKSL